jgi:hypothetical protein
MLPKAVTLPVKVKLPDVSKRIRFVPPDLNNNTPPDSTTVQPPPRATVVAVTVVPVIAAGDEPPITAPLTVPPVTATLLAFWVAMVPSVVAEAAVRRPCASTVIVAAEYVPAATDVLANETVAPETVMPVPATTPEAKKNSVPSQYTVCVDPVGIVTPVPADVLTVTLAPVMLRIM